MRELNIPGVGVVTMTAESRAKLHLEPDAIHEMITKTINQANLPHNGLPMRVAAALERKRAQ